MCEFLPMEVITVSQRISVVEFCSLIEIPSESQVRHAISSLCKQEGNFPDKFSYIKFPFGILDHKGLSMLLKYYERVACEKKVAEENAWLDQAKECCVMLSIDIDKIYQYFEDNVWSTGNKSSIRTLMCERWLTDEIIDTVFGILNKKHSDTICFVCKPTRIMYSSAGLSEKLRSICDNSLEISRVLIALNVGYDSSGAYYVSDESRQGLHWALLVIDVKSGKSYYGDSLGWSIPSNLVDTVGSNLKRMENDMGLNIINLENVIDISKFSCSTCSESCQLFYPLQSCSHVCGVIVVCMAAVLCDHWDMWLRCGNQIGEIPLLSNPSTSSMQLRLIVLSWIVDNNLTTTNLVCQRHSSDEDIATCKNTTSKNPTKHLCTNNPIDKQETNPVTHSDSSDEFMPTKYERSSTLTPSGYETDDEFIKFDNEGRSQILNMLPDGYTYKIVCITYFKDLSSFNCEFKIKLDSEDSAKKWVTDYNEKTKETMVFDSCKNLSGKRVVKKWYLRCHHKQRQTGMHKKSTRKLKTTHREHNNKHTDCPAQMILKLLAAKKHGEFCLGVALKHTHNHLVSVADALRFRPMSESTKEKYYELFRQGHSPSSAHLEYETHLTYLDDPKLLADRNVNPKKSDVYNLFNKWRKSNLGVRTGKQLFTDLEQRVSIYNDTHRNAGGRAMVQRYCKVSKTKCDTDVEQPLILAICTPLMSRVHQHIYQSKELVFVDASSSFEDYNNPLFVMSTSSAAGGLPLGIVITSAESTDVIHNGMKALQELLPESPFYGNGFPANIIIDDSSAEREGLKKTWPEATIYMCTFHFLQSMWRWLLCIKNGIHKDERQYLMNLVRKLVYACKESELKKEYQEFTNNTVVKRYPNFLAHMKGYWKRREEWAICFRTIGDKCMRGINTNNYAESGIRILKDIVFKRVKAYNLVQLFEFLTITFELYYERRLLAVAHNRMDRYISLRYKGLGVTKVAYDAINQSTTDCHIYFVKSTNNVGVEYEVDTIKWTCTCTVRRTGYPTGEPCKHQHSVAQKFNLIAPNLLPYFNGEGRYLHAIIALGKDRAGDKSFYVGMKESATPSASTSVAMQDETCTVINTDTDSSTDDDDGEMNLNMMLSIIEEQEKLKQDENGEQEKLKLDVIKLGNAFIEDVQERLTQMDTQYLSGLKKFFTVYMETVKSTEPAVSATPKLSSLLNIYFSKSPSPTQVAGTRCMHVQPTAVSRRRDGVPKGCKMAPSGRPPKRPLSECDPNIQVKRGRLDHVKRKQNLRLNQERNQSNHHKHGSGH